MLIELRILKKIYPYHANDLNGGEGNERVVTILQYRGEDDLRWHDVPVYVEYQLQETEKENGPTSRANDGPHHACGGGPR